MTTTIDMRLMRYINLFSKISRVSTTKCSVYNDHIIFAVPESQVSQAIGLGAINVRRMREILGKKVRIVVMPESPENKQEIAKFISGIVEPMEFNKIEINDGEIVVSAGRQSKAALIGRNRIREQELSNIVKNFLHIPKLRIT